MYTVKIKSRNVERKFYNKEAAITVFNTYKKHLENRTINATSALLLTKDGEIISSFEQKMQQTQ